MPDYRFYTVQKNGHLGNPPRNYELRNDEAALKEAKRLLNGHDMEIWAGARLVGYLCPDDYQD